MGTPHCGSESAYWFGFVGRALHVAQFGTGTNTKLLPALQKNSGALATISEQSIERLEKLEIKTFYETEKYLGVLVCWTLVIYSHWLRLISPKIVDKSSACLKLPNEKPPIPISADHKTMCKFYDADIQKFKPVWIAIKELVDSSLEVLVPQPPICT
jgi:hypothetical protein